MPPRYQETKINSNKRFPLCLGAFVAICAGLSGLGGTAEFQHGTACKCQLTVVWQQKLLKKY
jgi:hypothetical protein